LRDVSGENDRTRKSAAPLGLPVSEDPVHPLLYCLQTRRTDQYGHPRVLEEEIAEQVSP
jgi:hypothetical protein